MAIFRNFSTQKRDRSTGDRKRHKELVKQKIKDGIADIIAEESIIGKSKDQIIKVPIKGIKEYRFVFGSNNSKGVGQGTGKEQEGQVIGKDGKPQQGSGGPGDQEGDDIYETEITIEDAINYMFEDLELPEMDKKKLRKTEVESYSKLLGYQKKGIRSRLARRKTLINKLKRKKSWKRSGNEDVQNSFSFINDDLVYRRLNTRIVEHSNAVVFCIMDTSGSMDQIKKYLARSFYFLLFQFLKTRYEKTEIVFISHHVTAKEVTENDFFHKVESGGTCISSGYIKALELIKNNYPAQLWNIYAFHCSDGDNFESDNPAAIENAKKLTEVCNLFGYGEIKPHSSYSWSSMIEKYEAINADNFLCIKIREKGEVWPAFKKFLTLDKNKDAA